MRLTGTLGLSTSSKCHAIDSPSRSSSVASNSSLDSLMSFFSFAMWERFSGSSTYSGRKSLSTSTPNRAHGSFLYLAGMSLARRGKSRI